MKGGSLGCKLLPPSAHVGHRAALSNSQRASLSAAVDQRPSFDVIYAQADIGSCVANAGAGGCQQRLRAQGLGTWQPARLPLYRQALEADGVYPSDDGTFIETIVKVLSERGFADEALAPYSGRPSAIERVPSPAYVSAASRARLVTYAPLDQERDTLRFEMLAGNSIIFSMALRESFDDVGDDGRVPLPKKGEEETGGHAMRMSGYDSDGVIVANSWGRRWGRNGYCFIPWSMILDPNHTRSIYSIQTVQVMPS